MVDISIQLECSNGTITLKHNLTCALLWYGSETTMGKISQGDNISTKIESGGDRDRNGHPDFLTNCVRNWVGQPDFLNLEAIRDKSRPIPTLPDF